MASVGAIRTAILLLLAAFGSLFATAESSSITDHLGALVPSHYEFTEKFSCVNKLDVFLDRGALLTYSTDFLGSWPGNTHFDCRTYVYSKTRNTGIIAVIQELKLRKIAESCKDYVRFGEDTTDRCGEIAFGLKRSKSGKLPPAPEFISAFSGLFSRDLNLYYESGSIDSRKRFVSPGSWVTSLYTIDTDIHVHSQPEMEYEEDLQFVIAYTGFQDCEDTNLTGQMFNCGYGVCILSVFVNDGVVNCPFGDCRDEGGCDNAIRTSLLMTGEVNVTEAGVVTPTASHMLVGHARGSVTGQPVSLPVAYVLQRSSSAAVGDGIRDIGEELKKHNEILGQISSLLQKGMERLEGEKGGEGGVQAEKEKGY